MMSTTNEQPQRISQRPVVVVDHGVVEVRSSAVPDDSLSTDEVSLVRGEDHVLWRLSKGHVALTSRQGVRMGGV